MISIKGALIAVSIALIALQGSTTYKLRDSLSGSRQWRL